MYSTLLLLLPFAAKTTGLCWLQFFFKRLLIRRCHFNAKAFNLWPSRSRSTVDWHLVAEDHAFQTWLIRFDACCGINLEPYIYISLQPYLCVLLVGANEWSPLLFAVGMSWIARAAQDRFELVQHRRCFPRWAFVSNICIAGRIARLCPLWPRWQVTSWAWYQRVQGVFDFCVWPFDSEWTDIYKSTVYCIKVVDTDTHQIILVVSSGPCGCAVSHAYRTSHIKDLHEFLSCISCTELLPWQKCVKSAKRLVGRRAYHFMLIKVIII